MKRFLNLIIIGFVFTFVFTTAFAIVKGAIASKDSNINLIEAYLYGRSTSTVVSVFNLADADAQFTQPAKTETLSQKPFTKIILSNSQQVAQPVAETQTTDTPSSSTPIQTATTGTPASTTIMQALQVAEASIIHMQMFTSTSQ